MLQRIAGIAARQIDYKIQILNVQRAVESEAPARFKALFFAWRVR